jgi:hypothetical protein
MLSKKHRLQADLKQNYKFIFKAFQYGLGANEVKEEPSDYAMKRVMSTEASIFRLVHTLMHTEWDGWTLTQKSLNLLTGST